MEIFNLMETNFRNYKFKSFFFIVIIQVFVILFCLKNDVNPNGNEFSQELINSDFTEHYYSKQDSLLVYYSGLLNDSLRIPLDFLRPMIGVLDKYNWNNEFQEKDIFSVYHETVFSHQIPSGQFELSKWIVVVYSNHTANLCHAARGRLSRFDFRKLSTGWQLFRHYTAFAYGDEYGMEPLGFEWVKIGQSKYGLIVHTGYSGNGGHDMEFKSVYSELNDSLNPVFCLTSYEHYNDIPEGVEYTEGYIEMRIIENKQAWFEIQTSSDSFWDEETPGAIKRFVFNEKNKEYEEVK